MKTIIEPPIGQGLDLNTMRELAAAYHATSFVDEQPTDGSESGLLINPDDSDVQFGVATYDLADGFKMTHSIASYYPSSLRKIYKGAARVATDGYDVGRLAASYNDLIDITLPYFVPHVLVFPRINDGIIQALFASNAPLFSRRIATRVKLEGDFSEFIDSYAAASEDVGVFVYLAPNIMEVVLEKLTEFTIEFVDNHVYLYYRPRKAVANKPGANTYLNMDIHKLILQVGLSLGDKLANTTRPLQQQNKVSSRIGRPSFRHYFWAFSVVVFPLLLLIPSPLTLIIAVPFLFLGFDIDTMGMIAPISSILLFLAMASYRYFPQRARMGRYRMRYGNENK